MTATPKTGIPKKLYVACILAGVMLGILVGAWATWRSSPQTTSPTVDAGTIDMEIVNFTGANLNDIYPSGATTAHFHVNNQSTLELEGIYPAGDITGETATAFIEHTTVTINVCTQGYTWNNADPQCANWQTVAQDVDLEDFLENETTRQHRITTTTSNLGIKLDFTYKIGMPEEVQGKSYTGSWTFTGVQREGELS